MRPRLIGGMFIVSLVVLLAVVNVPLVVRSRHASAEERIKVFAPKDVFTAAQEGVWLWHDYGRFGLYRVNRSTLAHLPPDIRQRVRILDDAPPLHFATGDLNPRAPLQAIPAIQRTPSPEGPTLYLVQFVGPIKDEWLDLLNAMGATPVHYVAQYGYIVWADANVRARLERLARDGDIIQFAMPHQPALKVGRSLLDRLAETPTDETVVTVTVQVYAHEQKHVSQKRIEALAIRRRAGWRPVLQYENAVFDVALRDVPTIAALPDVMWVGERLPRERMDEVQGQLLAGNIDASGTAPSGPGYLAWLDSLGFSQNPADYPIVDIVDDGIGDGTLDTGDPTLHQFGQSGLPSRVAYIANCTSASDGSGPDGHGHLNASIAFGYDTRTGFPYQDPNGFQRGLGINPYGRLASTRVFSGTSFDLSNCGNSDMGLIKQIQENGARISSNSWGCAACANTYDEASQAFDAGTRDADPTEPGNQEILFIFAAGNSGPNSGTVGTPGNAKNVLTVGASENVRPGDEDGEWWDGCYTPPTQADNAMDIATFSSRGPAPGNRAKPEVVAPGTHVQGTASTAPGYTGAGVCDPYRPSGQTIFAASSGTSHSTPAVAGMASLTYYWLQKVYTITTPSPALLKAYIMAHTTYLTGTDANDTLPSPNQGYGMPTMRMAFDETPRFLVNQSVVFDETGETWTWYGSVADPTKPVVIVLNYTDAPGAVGTSPQVNDLDLEVTIAGTLYRGNIFDGQWSIPGGTPDTANNYEVIRLPAGTSGALRITVLATNIAGDGVPNVGDATDQDFALVCYNCSQSPSFFLDATPTTARICTPQNATFGITATPVLGYSQPISLSTTGHPSGTLAFFMPNPITPPATSTLTISDTANAAFGSYTIHIAGIAPTSTHTTTVQLDLFTAPPAPPTLLSPANGAAGVSIEPTLMWSSGAQADSHRLEVATDTTFSALVYTATLAAGEQSHTITTRLQTSTTYFWRVRSVNPCGESAFSEVFQFTTRPTPPILLVDDDDNDPDVQAFYTTTLEALGMRFDVWDTAQSGNEPTFDDLAPYTLVLWFSGDGFNTAGPSAESENSLASWLESGNRCLFISSQDYYWARQLTPFMKTYLGIDGIGNDVQYTRVSGQGTLFGALGPYTLDYDAIGAYNWSDTITPTLGTQAVYTATEGIAAVMHETETSKTMYWGFSFEALPTQTDRIANMATVLGWCDALRPYRTFIPLSQR